MKSLSQKQIRWLFGGLGAGAFAALLTLEVVTEEGGISFLEVFLEATEILLMVAAAGGVTLLVQNMHAHHEEKMALIRDLETARSEGEGWRSKVQSHLEGIGAAIDNQFKVWEMTEAERDVGLLILKGLSHKEIAVLRSTNDATVRQQARSLYHKSGLPGKAAFSAYFLEDLLPPNTIGSSVGSHKTESLSMDLTDHKAASYTQPARARG